MEQYISKSALIAEIEKRINEEIQSWATNLGYSQGCVDSMRNVLSFIDTLEAKEVDLEKELGKYLDANDIEFINQIKLLDFAKHFFELGLVASNKAQNVWHDASEKLPTGVIVVNNGGNLHIGWSTEEGDGIEDEHGRLITKTYQKWAREKDLT